MKSETYQHLIEYVHQQAGLVIYKNIHNVVSNITFMQQSRRSDNADWTAPQCEMWNAHTSYWGVHAIRPKFYENMVIPAKMLTLQS